MKMRDYDMPIFDLFFPFLLILFVYLTSEQERFLGNKALNNEDDGIFFMANPYTKNVSLGLLSLYAIAQFFHCPSSILGWLALSNVCIFIARLQDWHHSVLLRCFRVWQYYLALWLVILHFMLLAVGRFFLPEWQDYETSLFYFVLIYWCYMSISLWLYWAKN